MDPRPLRVADVMTTEPVVIDVDASLADADQILRFKYITGLPVVDGTGALVGVISHADLIAYRFDRPTPPVEVGSIG